MNVQVNWLRKIKTEYTHYRLGINYISARNKIKVNIEFSDIVDKVKSFVNDITKFDVDFDLTLSIEFNEIFTVFIRIPP